MLIDENLSFLHDDPGAVQYGNFINYYSFHPVSDRINHLDDKMFQKSDAKRLRCLDVGCNTGELSTALLNYLQTKFPDCDIEILAIDIDPVLIERAVEINKTQQIQFAAGNIMEDSCKKIIECFLQGHQKEAFDITFCFSITMWIHLNNGDAGLMEFLEYIQSISKSIIIEPQPWKCYKSAQKRLKKAGSSFEKLNFLKIRNDVESVIENALSKKFKKTIETINPWQRKIQCYHKEGAFKMKEN